MVNGGRFNMSSNYGVKAFQKIQLLLDCFSTVDRSLTVSELAERSGLPTSTAHRLAQSLREIGLLDQDRNRREYRLGIRLFELGNTVLLNMDILDEARAFVQMLTELSEETVHLCVFDGGRMAYIDRVAGGRSGPNNSTVVMETSPCHCTGVGKATLAWQSNTVIDRIARLGLAAYTGNTITDPALLARELERIRAQGYALDLAEMELGLHCVAAPIRNVTGKVIAAISVSGPARRLSQSRLHELAPEVVRHANLISARLGWRPPAQEKVTMVVARKTARLPAKVADSLGVRSVAAPSSPGSPKRAARSAETVGAPKSERMRSPRPVSAERRGRMSSGRG
jgi:DNA-binding IclR family transcriptional regulator